MFPSRGPVTTGTPSLASRRMQVKHNAPSSRRAIRTASNSCVSQTQLPFVKVCRNRIQDTGILQLVKRYFDLRHLTCSRSGETELVRASGTRFRTVSPRVYAVAPAIP